MQKIYESQGRPKAKDYDDMTQEVLTIAIAVYRCLVCINTPFLDHTKELEFIKIGWQIACKKMEIRLKMTPELVKMVSICPFYLTSADDHFADHFSRITCPWRAQDQSQTNYQTLQL